MSNSFPHDAQNIPTSCPKYSRIIYKPFPNHFQVMPKTFPNHAHIMYKHAQHTSPPTPFYPFSCFTFPSINQQGRNNIHRNPHNHHTRQEPTTRKWIKRCGGSVCIVFSNKNTPPTPFYPFSCFHNHPHKTRTYNTKMDKTLWGECFYCIFQQKHSPHTVLSIFLLPQSPTQNKNLQHENG